MLTVAPLPTELRLEHTAIADTKGRSAILQGIDSLFGALQKMEEKVVGRFTVAAVPNKPTAKRTELSGKANGLVGSGSLKGRHVESKAVERRPSFSSDTNGMRNMELVPIAQAQ